jgi:hypothetical protein
MVSTAGGPSYPFEVAPLNPAKPIPIDSRRVLGGSAGAASHPLPPSSFALRFDLDNAPNDPTRATPARMGHPSSERSSVAESHNLAGGPLYREGAPFTGVPGEPVRWGGRSSPGLAWAGVGEASRFCRVHPDWISTTPSSPVAQGHTSSPKYVRCVFMRSMTPRSDRPSPSESGAVASKSSRSV